MGNPKGGTPRTPGKPNAALWAARTRLAMSQAALARTAGVDEPKLTLIERHGWIPGPDVQERLAAALGCSIADLFGAEAARIMGATV